jgi:TolB-like protein/tetratricopeptide (TPR) repeat protein
VERPLPAYRGQDPYVFVCYAHADEQVVYPDIRWLQVQGVNVWYDEGISAGKVWRAEIAEAIEGASVVLFHVSRAALDSDHCNREINYALDAAKDLIPVYLEDVPLTPDLRVGLSRVQALRRDDAAYRDHLLRALGALSRPRPVALSDSPPSRRRAPLAAWWTAGLLVLLSAGAGWWAWTHRPTSQTAVELEVLPSIAVLPFDNLSASTEDAYFTDGVHDEILARLAKVSGLKVISRSSVMAYRDHEQNARSISTELGARYLVEGTVRRFPNEVVVTAQLIDGRDDTHLWVETYQRELADLFGIQTQVAERIVRTLQAQLTPDEATRIGSRPTQSAEAYDLYLRALDALSKRQGGALELLEGATAIDPSFAVAYARISRIHRDAFFFNLDATPERLRMAKEAVDRALALEPSLPEAHLALGMYHYANRDYALARAELETARQGLPNDVPVHMNLGHIYRREGRLRDAISSFEAALERAPNLGGPAMALGESYLLLRDYETSREYLTRAEILSPDNGGQVMFGVLLDLRAEDFEQATGRLAQWRGGPSAPIGHARFELLFWVRDFERARTILEQGSWDAIRLPDSVQPRELLLGQAENWLGDMGSAVEHLEAALKFLDAELQAKPDDHRLIAARGLALAALGRREEAVDAGRRASELMPMSKDAIDGAVRLRDLAAIYAAVGEPTRALEIAGYLLSVPSPFCVEELMHRPEWDSLREDPEYDRLVAEYRR